MLSLKSNVVINTYLKVNIILNGFSLVHNAKFLVAFFLM